MIAENELPRVQGKVLGFRQWGLQGYKLRSLIVDAYWTIGVNEAQCYREHTHWFTTPAGEHIPPHIAPHPQCECGLYAMHAPWIGSWGHGLPAVWGAVLAWGRIEVHADGFRAQYAEPVMFAYHPEYPYEDVCRAKAVISEMGFPFVPLPELRERAKAFGEPVAAGLRPVPPAQCEVENPATVSRSPRAPRWPWRGSAAWSGIWTLENGTFFVIRGRPLSLVMAVVSAVLMVFFVRGAWHDRKKASW